MNNLNPFVVLGLNSQVLRSLNDEQIAGLVKSQYRALQMIYHPDSPSGSEKKSRELNEAYSLLENPETYQLFKNNFLKPSQRGAKERSLESAVEKANIRCDKAMSTLLEYVSKANEENSIYNLAPCALRMLDSVSQSNISTLTKIIHRDGCKNLFYELSLKRNGQITRRKGKTTMDLPNKRLIGAISPEVIRKYGSIPNVLRLAQDIETPDDVSVRNFFKQNRLPGRTKEVRYASPRISMQDFKQLAPLITPVVEEGSCLISLNTKEEPAFEVDGLVVEITKKVK